MRQGNEAPQLSWNKKQTEKLEQSVTCRAKPSKFGLRCSKNNVKNVIAVNAFLRKWLCFSRMALFNRNLFNVILKSSINSELSQSPASPGRIH